MERSKDADHLTYSDAMYPVGPNVSGDISYVHLPPLSALNGACCFFMGWTYGRL